MMTIEASIELRHHDLISERDINKLQESISPIRIKTRLLEETDIYDEGVLPPMITIFCKMEEAKTICTSSVDFLNTLTNLIDEIRAQEEPGFYSTGEKGEEIFTPVPSLAIFVLLQTGEKLKLYITEKEGTVCKEAVKHIPVFFSKYNFLELKAPTALGLIAIYKTDSKSWNTVGF